MYFRRRSTCSDPEHGIPRIVRAVPRRAVPGSAAMAQPMLSRILRLNSRRVSFVRCSGRAAAAKAAIRSTAELGLDSVIVGITTFGPIVSRLLHDIGQLRDCLHILQSEFYRHQQAERGSMLHIQGLTVEMCGEQCLRMAGRRQIE